MSSILAAVRQIASDLGRRAEERFCLIYESQLVDTNGFAFIPSAELTERDAIDKLIDAGYDLRDALQAIVEARLFCKALPVGCHSRTLLRSMSEAQASSLPALT
jgi:hypothetical protein